MQTTGVFFAIQTEYAQYLRSALLRVDDHAVATVTIKNTRDFQDWTILRDRSTSQWINVQTQGARSISISVLAEAHLKRPFSVIDSMGSGQQQQTCAENGVAPITFTKTNLTLTPGERITFSLYTVNGRLALTHTSAKPPAQTATPQRARANSLDVLYTAAMCHQR